jgi:hypothetical protein
VQEQLGHASIPLIVDLYGHLMPGGSRAAVDKFDDIEPVGGPGRAGITLRTQGVGGHHPQPQRNRDPES